MIRLPEDRMLETSSKILDIYSSSSGLDDFKIKVLKEFPDDPTLSYGYWLGLMVGRLEGKTKIANRLLELAEEFWGGNEKGVRIEDLELEIEIDNKLLAERQRILDACQCPEHGSCVPYVLEQLQHIKELSALNESLMENGNDLRRRKG